MRLQPFATLSATITCIIVTTMDRFIVPLYLSSPSCSPHHQENRSQSLRIFSIFYNQSLHPSISLPYYSSILLLSKSRLGIQRAMARSVDLPNELLCKIGILLNTNNDKLCFIAVNKRTLKLLIPILFEHLAIGSSLNWLHPLCKVKLLWPTLTNKSSNIGHAVHSVRVENHQGCSRELEVVSQLPILTPNLKNICIVTPLGCAEDTEQLLFSTIDFRRILCAFTGTLKTLTLCVGGDDYYTGRSGIGSLKHLTGLETLCVQLHLLLGDESGDHLPPEIMRGTLPASLQRFTLHMRCQSGNTDDDENLQSHFDDGRGGPGRYASLDLEYKGTVPRRLTSLHFCLMGCKGLSGFMRADRGMRFIAALNDVDFDVMSARWDVN